MKRPLVGLIFAIAVLIFLVYVISTNIPKSNPITIDNMTCAVDSDCAPAQCCHATSVVNKNFAPDCANIFCTMECRSGTIDCDNGEIKCVNSECTVIWPKK
jgi:hypothetical protein